LNHFLEKQQVLRKARRTYITENTNSANSGGMFLNAGTFTMSGGIIFAFPQSTTTVFVPFVLVDYFKRLYKTPE
jgi:hypothetical protein